MTAQFFRLLKRSVRFVHNVQNRFLSKIFLTSLTKFKNHVDYENHNKLY